ncbi:hypothetical protein [Treponema sp.]|uniref:hypothetical protein n=1 Tax=Treponema sp. TaxID=166 RepID=UPI0025E63568|nr:hypothetical protein [Treponema sp.]MCR5218370.1 hypothetical protein [Treponema sp.]
MKKLFMILAVLCAGRLFTHSVYAEEIKKHNDNGDLIYSKDNDGIETWYSYHLNGTVAVIHNKDKIGYEEWYFYDGKGQEIHVKYSNGIETWNEYDERGNLIHSRDNKGFSVWCRYDKNDRRVYYKNALGDEINYEYDDKGNQYYNNRGTEYWTCSKPVEMVVLTDDGLPLRYRKIPVDGEKLGNFKNETLVYATKRTSKKYEADGLSDYWYLVQSVSDSQKQGWVFGAYLSLM